MSKKLPIRPYARLLTMLGEQLIKNETIAFVELVKNSYDADAENVALIFENFNEDMSVNENSVITIKDDGHGMSREVIEDAWMNPATPHKFKDAKKTTPKGRIIQGEKGIGRFAILKLGKKITITTRAVDSDIESTVLYDFSRFDDDFTAENGEDKTIYLDEVSADYSKVKPEKFDGNQHGTIIRIEDVKGEWNERAIKQLTDGISSLTDPISRIAGGGTPHNFKVSLITNGRDRQIEDDNAQEIRRLIDDKAVLKIEGQFCATRQAFIYKMGDQQEFEISMDDSKIKGLWVWKKHFGEKKPAEKPYSVGDFRFHFNIFDFTRGISDRYRLDRGEKDSLKKHRIYLYRDKVRVYPYGDPDDDWLNIDTDRGTGKVGHFFSNDQIVGWVEITREGNPKLRDKTNREGLIESGGSARDFIGLIKVFLSYVKQKQFDRYQAQNKAKKAFDAAAYSKVEKDLVALSASLKDGGHKSESRQVSKIAKEYKAQIGYLAQRAETTEELAGVGLSVEMSSHDIMLMLQRAREVASRIGKLTETINDKSIREQVDSLIGILAQVVETMRDIQPLFKSSKRRRKNLKVEPLLDKIYSLYERLINRNGIEFIKNVRQGSPLIADTTDGVIMQTEPPRLYRRVFSLSHAALHDRFMSS